MVAVPRLDELRIQPSAVAAILIVAVDGEWKDGVLAVARVSTFADAARFMGLPDRGEPPSMEPAALATFIRETSYRGDADVGRLVRHGTGDPAAGGIVAGRGAALRLIDKKAAFEWQQGVLVSWDGQKMQLMVGGQPNESSLSPDALIYQRIGDERVAMSQGSWIGGEIVDFRAEGNTIRMLVYRINFANPAADRFSRLAIWQVRKARQELDTAFRGLNIGDLTDMRFVERGQSGRPLRTEIVGTAGRRTVAPLRLRTLLSLRDSLFSFVSRGTPRAPSSA